jgi:hypothetical protein
VTRSLLIGLLAAAGLLAGCTGAGAVFHHQDSGAQEIGLPETSPPGGNGGATGGAGAGGDDGGVDGGDAGDPWAPTVKAISAGRDYLVAAFPTQAGVIVVRAGHIEIVSRDGASLALIATPRDNVSASFDGTHLVVADRAMLTAYDTSLTSMGETPVGEPCYSIAAVSNRVVCTAFYGAYPFWSYVPRPGGTPVRSSYSGSVNQGVGSVFGVPGRQQLLQANTGSFDKSLMLFDVSAAGVVSDTAGSVGEGFESGTLGPSFVAFDRTTPQRLMASSGNFYRLGAADCVTAKPQTCLVPDGKLAPRFTPSEIIVAAVGDGAGHFLVLRTRPYAVQKPLCALGCALDSVDAVTGQVDRTTIVRFSLDQPVSAEYDPIIDGMVLGSRSQDGDRVTLLDFSVHTDPVGPGPDPASGPAPIPTPPDSPPSGCAPSKQLFHGQKSVLTAAPVPGGLILARYDGLFRMDRGGNVLSTVTRAQPSLAAVFDTGTLAVGDAQGLAFYDQTLSLLREIPVANGCQGVVFLSAGRVVCDSRDPIYSSAGTLRTYAVDSGALLATSPVDGMWAVAPRMRRVPGVDALVNESNYLYLLYGAAPGGAVSFVNTSPMQGMYLGGLPFTFWGSGRSGTPPVHLVSWSGSLVKIYNPDCQSTGAPFDAGCFIPDGELGTLRGAEWFAAMVTDGQDLYTVTMDTDANFFPPSTRCAGDCLLVQHIDIPSRRVISSRMNSIPLARPGHVIAIEHDAECGMLLVASFNDSIDPNNPTVDPNNPDYSVDLLDYGAP